MEKGLNSRDSITKIRKSYKKTNASKSSLDQTAFRHFDLYNNGLVSNIRSSLQSSLMRNTYNNLRSSAKSQQSQIMRIKGKKTSNLKKPNFKELIDIRHRYSASYFGSALTSSNKSKCGSMVNCEQMRIGNQISKYKFIYQIGFGGFGKVWKVMKRKYFKEFAMKQISKQKVIQKDNVQSIMNERFILSSLNHPFLINMHSSFQDQQNLYLTMDYLRGADLRYHICYKEQFNEAQIKFIVASILVGLEYVHQKGIIHRDIKPENIVFEQTGYPRLTDFGIAKAQSSSNLPVKFQSSGTPGYMAPQILCKLQYSFQSDFFAIGVIIYQLIMGHRPYQGKNRQQIRENILRNEVLLSQQQLPGGFNKSVVSFVNQLLQRNPEQRLGHNGFKQVKSHKWLKDIKWKALERKEITPPFIPDVVCETKQYLDEILLYNQMITNDQNIQTISAADQYKFQQYDYKKVDRQKVRTQKPKQTTQDYYSLSVFKSKQILTKHNSQLMSTLLMKSSTSNNFFKKNRRNSQQKLAC